MNKKDWYNLSFYYDNGILYHMENKKKAGYTSKNKYVTIKKNYIKDYAHRIIYIMFYGDIPENHDIHHIDGDRSNNRIENLESVSRLKHNFKKDKSPIMGEDGNWQIVIRYNYNNYRFYNIDKDELLKVYNSLIVIDIDKLESEQIIESYNCLLSDDHVVSFWKSPSNKGFKGFALLLLLVCFVYNISHDN